MTRAEAEELKRRIEAGEWAAAEITGATIVTADSVRKENDAAVKRTPGSLEANEKVEESS